MRSTSPANFSRASAFSSRIGVAVIHPLDAGNGVTEHPFGDVRAHARPPRRAQPPPQRDRPPSPGRPVFLPSRSLVRRQIVHPLKLCLDLS